MSMGFISDFVESNLLFFSKTDTSLNRRDVLISLIQFEAQFDTSLTVFRQMPLLVKHGAFYRLKFSQSPQHTTDLSGFSKDQNLYHVHDGYLIPPWIYAKAGSKLWRSWVKSDLLKREHAKKPKVLAYAKIAHEVALFEANNNRFTLTHDWFAYLAEYFSDKDEQEQATLKRSRTLKNFLNLATQARCAEFILTKEEKYPYKHLDLFHQMDGDTFIAWWFRYGSDKPVTSTQTPPANSIRQPSIPRAKPIGFLSEDAQLADGEFASARFTPDEKTVVAVGEACDEHVLILWDIDKHQLRCKPIVHETEILAASVSANGSQVLTLAEDGYLRRWHIDSGDQLGHPIQHSTESIDGGVASSRFCFNDSFILAASSTQISLYDVTNGRRTLDICGSHVCSDDGVEISHDSKRLISWGSDSIQVWDIDSGESVHPPMTHKSTEWGTIGVVLHPFEDKLVSFSISSGGDNAIRCWDLASGKLISGPMAHDEHVNGAIFSADGHAILSWSFDSTLRVWDTLTGKQRSPTMQHDENVNGAVFIDDDQSILSWSADETVRLWDAKTGEPLNNTIDHAAPVMFAQMLPNHSAIVIAGNTVQIWEESGETLMSEVSRLSLSDAVLNSDHTKLLAYGGGFDGYGLYLFEMG